MAEFDLTGTDAWVRSQTEEFVLTILNSGGDGEDLTGALVELEIKKSDGDDDPPLLKLDNDASGGLAVTDQTVDANLGIVNGVASAARTATLAPGTYRYDVFVNLGGTVRKQALHGRLQVKDTPNHVI